MKETILEFNPNSNPTDEYYKKLGANEKEAVDKFEKYCLISAGKGRAKKSKSNAVRFLVMVNKPINKISLEDLRDFLRILKQSDFSDYYKNDVKGFVQRFLKWAFKDWSERFNNFDDISFNADAQRKKKINPKDVLIKEDIEKLIKAETSIYWKCFISCQYSGALRSLETRQLKWDMIDTEDSEVYFLKIKSRKNKNGTEKERIAVPLDSNAVYLINELKKWQEETENKSVYLFPSKEDVNNYISSGTVSKWFSRLTKRVLGVSKTNYLLRHSKGEILHELVRDGKLSKENAILMMGHSEKMFDKTYSHPDKKKFKEVLKKQVLNVDYIAPVQKHKLELEIEKLKSDKIETSNQLKELLKRFDAIENKIKPLDKSVSRLKEGLIPNKP